MLGALSGASTMNATGANVLFHYDFSICRQVIGTICCQPVAPARRGKQPYGLQLVATTFLLCYRLEIMLPEQSDLHQETEEKRTGSRKPRSAWVPNGPGIKTLRQQCNLTQEELAAKVGVSERTLGSWERGDNNISPENLKALAGALSDASLQVGLGGAVKAKDLLAATAIEQPPSLLSGAGPSPLRHDGPTQTSRIDRAILLLDGDLGAFETLRGAFEQEMLLKFGIPLQVVNIKRGSIIVELEGPEGFFDELKERIDSGEIQQIHGFPVRGIQLRERTAAETQSQGSTPKESTSARRHGPLAAALSVVGRATAQTLSSIGRGILSSIRKEMELAEKERERVEEKKKVDSGSGNSLR
jgi:transcriptional regulator with XRE-family HTH domain